MVSKFFRLTMICLIIFAVFCQPALSGKELTRADAKEKLLNKIPKIATLDFSREIPRSDIDKFTKAINAGLLSMQEVIAFCNLKITNAGRKYLLKETEGIGSFLRVKIGDRIFDEITGIKSESPTKAIVEYTCKLTNITPFGPPFGIQDGKIEKREAKFELYDDGWRLMKDERV